MEGCGFCFTAYVYIWVWVAHNDRFDKIINFVEQLFVAPKNTPQWMIERKMLNDVVKSWLKWNEYSFKNAMIWCFLYFILRATKMFGQLMDLLSGIIPVAPTTKPTCMIIVYSHCP